MGGRPKGGTDERLRALNSGNIERSGIWSETNRKEGMGGRRGEGGNPRGGRGEEEEGVGKAD